jgi:uncharacterized protein YneF (UPF0154 family)
MMPINHIVLVPVTLAVGFAFGYWWGTKTVRQQWEKAERRRRQAEGS